MLMEGVLIMIQYHHLLPPPELKASNFISEIWFIGTTFGIFEISNRQHWHTADLIGISIHVLDHINASINIY